jgi:AAHS family 4-hydroxybenzoate transporter-like MFS transporter
VRPRIKTIGRPDPSAGVPGSGPGGFTRAAVGVVTLSFFIMLIDGYDLQAMGFAAPALAIEWNIKRELLGPVLAASLAGMGVGSIVLGWFGDRVGRKFAFCTCIFLLALGSACSAWSGSLTPLVIWRFVTGLGLGGATPLAASLAAEWSPRRWRSLAVAIVVVAVPAGGMLGALLAQRLIPHWGWRSVFVLGAVLPSAILGIAWWRLSESPEYRERDSASAAADPSASLTSLVRAPYRATTLLLWLAFACNTLTLYSFVNWLPTVLSAAGATLRAALQASFLFNMGGIAGAVLGSSAISFLGSRGVGTGFAIVGAAAAVSIGLALAGAIPGGVSIASVLALLTIAGASLNGMQGFLYAVGANSYPAQIRGSGVGSASAVARVGGVLSSVVGSAFFAWGLSVGQFFYIVAAIILITVVSFFSLRSHIPRRSRAGGAPGIDRFV